MSNLPAIPTVQEFATMKELGKMAISSGFLPASIKTPEQAVVIMLKGRELGIPPMQAFSGINVIQGKPAVSPELMTALIYKNAPGTVINFIRTDNDECVIEAKRPGGAMNRFSFTMQDAKRAGLDSKATWKSFPAAMLRARCLSAMARALFPDAIAGCSYTPEELGAEVDDEGNVLSLPPESQQESKSPEPEKPRDVTPKKSEVDDPGSHLVDWGEFKANPKTLKQIIDESGLPRIQNYLNSIEKSAQKKGEALSGKAVFTKVALQRYERQLMNPNDIPPWQDEEWPE